MNKHQKSVAAEIEPMGFAFEGYAKGAAVFRHPQVGPLRVHATPTNKGSTQQRIVRIAKHMVDGRQRANELFLDWLCQKYEIGPRQAKRIKMSVIDEIREWLKETGDKRSPMTLNGWFSLYARDTGRVARLDMALTATWEIRGVKWGITQDETGVAPEAKNAPVGLIRPGPGSRSGKKGPATQRKRETGGAAPPPVVSIAPPPPEPPKPPKLTPREERRAAAEPGRSEIANGQDQLLAAGWERAGQQWRHPDLPNLGRVWFSKAIESERLRQAWPSKPAIVVEVDAATLPDIVAPDVVAPEPEPERADVRIEVPVATPVEAAQAAVEAVLPPAAQTDSEVMDLFQKVARMVQEPMIKRAEDAEALAELRTETLREALTIVTLMENSLQQLRHQIRMAIDGA